MIIVGIDPSINGTGLCRLVLDKDFNIIDIKFIGFSKVKKILCNTKLIDIINLPDGYINYPYYYRGELIYNLISDYIKDAEYIAIEDYAMNANGFVFDIAEFVGTLKHYIYSNKIPLKKISPLSVKEFATGSGVASKLQMWASFSKIKLHDDIYEIFKQYELGKSPSADLVDSFFIANLLRCELCFKENASFPKEHITKYDWMFSSIVSKKGNLKSLPTIHHLLEIKQ